MALPPFYLLPQGSSFHRLPDFSTAKSRIELVTDHLVRAGLYFHWIQRTQALDPARLSTEISSAVSKIASVYESCAYLHSHCFSLHSMPVAEKVALFLLHLEDGAFSKQFLIAEFDALDLQCKDFLVHIVARSHRIPVEDAKAAIHQNPCLLLQLENSKSENVLEVLLERLDQRASLRTELNKLAIYKSIPDQLKIQLAKSPLLSLFSWFVWYDEGGKDDLTFASSNYGQERIDEDPSIIFKLSGLKLFCSSLEVGQNDEFSLIAEEKERDPLII
jgi:hypothetical protein